jgi:hypothetical protein
VTAGYVTIPIEAQIAALNLAALKIDGETTANIIAFPGTIQKAAVGQ